jgi:hypothetical protein
MANNPRQSFDKPVITRYGVEHVGGTFDAKNIPRPDPLEVAMKVASLKESGLSSLAPVGLSSERYGVPKFTATRPEPKGKGKIDAPGRGTPRLRYPVYSTPVSGPGQPVFWNTDPDIWDITKLIGPEYWDGPDITGHIIQ